MVSEGRFQLWIQCVGPGAAVSDAAITVKSLVYTAPLHLSIRFSTVVLRSTMVGAYLFVQISTCSEISSSCPGISY